MWDGTRPPGDFDDPSTWTDFTWEGCSGLVLANLPDMRRDYDAVIVALDLRAEAVRLKGSYTWSESKGNGISDVSFMYASDEYDAFPLDFYNVYGYMDDDARHRVRLNGFWLLPLDFTLSLDYTWESPRVLWVTAACNRLGNLTADGYDWVVDLYCQNGGSLANDAYLEPRGSRRAPEAYDQLDLGLSKGFRFKGVTLELSAAVVNVFGDEEPVWWWTKDYDPDYEWGQELEWSRPRRYEVGVRLEF